MRKTLDAVVVCIKAFLISVQKMSALVMRERCKREELIGTKFM